MKKITIDDLPIEDQERFEKIALLFKDKLRKCLMEGGKEIDETDYFFFLASKEFFNLFHGIVTPEMVWMLESVFEEEFKKISEDTIEVKLVNGNILTFKSGLPPQGTWNGEPWHGIVNLKELMGFEI